MVVDRLEPYKARLIIFPPQGQKGEEGGFIGAFFALVNLTFSLTI